MNHTSILFLFLETCRRGLHFEVGQIFDYQTENDGLKIIAELAARFQQMRIATMLLPELGVDNITIIPSGEYNRGFSVDEKLRTLHEAGNQLMIIQHERLLHTEKNVILKIRTDGTMISMYTVGPDKKGPVFMTMIDLSETEDMGLAVYKLMKLVTDELEVLAGFMTQVNSEFTPL